MAALGAAGEPQLAPKPLRPPFEIRARWQPGAGGRAASLVVDYVEGGRYVVVEFQRQRLVIGQVAAGRRVVLANVEGWLPDGLKELRVRVRRTRHEIVVAANDACLARVRIAAPAEGKIGVSNPERGGHLSNLKIQRLGKIAFNDGFMRTAAELGQWMQVAGTWRVAGEARPRFSANPFCFLGQGKGALATAGHAFWSDYLATAAVRPTAGVRALGVAFAITASGDHYRFEWRRGVGQAGRFRLVRRRGGRDTVMETRPGELARGQWYEFQVLTIGARIEAAVDGRVVFRAPAPALFAGKVGLWCDGRSPAYFDDVRVLSVPDGTTRPTLPSVIPSRKVVVHDVFAHDKYMQAWSKRAAPLGKGETLDDTFHYAPVDWSVYTGRWGVMARWACQPRWTWFGGQGRHAATIWHKRKFRGDLAVEVFAAHPMDSPFDPLYRHPGNMNITICGDGRNLDSGYSFIFAGGGDRWTRLLRRGKVVAETRDVLLPDSRNKFYYKSLHIHWYGLRVQRVGNEITCFVDDRQALQWRDPQPLTGARAAIWTYDNTLLITRARITADRIEPGDLPDAALAWMPADGHARGNPTNAEAAKTPRRRWDFERNRDGWQNRDGEYGAKVSLEKAGGRSCLKLANVKAGGTFAVSVPLVGFDARRTNLRFDYKAQPGVKINLYLKVRGQWYMVGFSAPNARAWRAPMVGRFKDVRCDGIWRRASVELGQYFNDEALVRPASAAIPKPQRNASAGLVIDDAFFGLMADDAYAMAGFGANHAGVTYYLDNVVVSVGGPRPRAPEPGAPGRARGVGPILCNDWRTFGGPDGLAVLSTPWEKADRSRCIMVVNEKLGGIAGVTIRSEPFDARLHPIVSFDYKVDDTPRLDFHVQLASGKTCADRWRTVKFTDSDHAWDVVGAASGIVRDGQWHHCEFDLGAMLRERGDDTTVTRLLLASGGWPGNEEGARVCFDNFRLLPKKASPSAAADAEPPRVLRVTPAPGRASGDCRIAVQLADKGSGVVPASIRLWVNGRAYSISDREMSYDPRAALLTWDGLAARPSPVTFRDGETVTCKLGCADYGGNRMPKPRTWQWRMRDALDKTPPPAPWISRAPGKRMVWQDFEQGSASWGDWGGCDVQHTSAVSATGLGALMLTAFDPHRSAVALRDVKPIPVAEFPYVAFDYMLQPAQPAKELRFEVSMLIFDGQRDRRLAIAGIPSDRVGGWRHVEIDLRKSIKPSMGAPYGLLIGMKAVKALRPGSRVFVDNFAVYSRQERSVRVAFSAPADATGIVGYSWVLDQKPDTVPDEKVEGPDASASWAGLAPGNYYVHARAKDGAGNWGATRHLKVVVE